MSWRSTRPREHGEYKLRRDFYEVASDAQLGFFAERYWRGLLDQADCVLQIRSSADPHALRDVAPGKIMRHNQSRMPAVEWQQAKDAEGRFSFTIGLYATEAMAAEAGLSIEDYWQQIISACFLEDPDPVARWREVNRAISHHCQFLNSLPIDRLHVEAEATDLWLTLGEAASGSGAGVAIFQASRSSPRRIGAVRRGTSASTSRFTSTGR